MTQTTEQYTAAELMACVFAREMKGMKLGNVPGVRSEVPLAAIGLAARLYAPGFKCFNVGPVAFSALQITGSTMDYERMIGAEGIMNGERIYDMLHKGIMECSFGGGMQIDKFANTNLVCVGEWKKPKVRGPGAAGTFSTSMAKRYFIWINEHTPRVFVDKVDFISVPGPATRIAAGTRMGGEPLVVTPLAVMDLEPASRQLRLKSVHPGVSVEEVKRKTGFELNIKGPVATTIPPSDLELKTLRTEVDPMGVLRSEEPFG